jgi:mono/diheme cytochrome c family protein
MTSRTSLLLSLCLSTTAFAEDASELWKARCKSCHGEDGRAQTRMGQKEALADLTQPAWQQSVTDEAIRQVIAEGSPRNAKMKPFKEKLTPEQISSLVTYIRGMKK